MEYVGSVSPRTHLKRVLHETARECPKTFCLRYYWKRGAKKELRPSNVLSSTPAFQMTSQGNRSIGAITLLARPAAACCSDTSVAPVTGFLLLPCCSSRSSSNVSLDKHDFANQQRSDTAQQLAFPPMPAQLNLHSSSSCVPEPWLTLNDQFASGLLLVVSHELPRHQKHQHNDYAIGRDACIDAGAVARSILRPEDQAASDAAHTTHADEDGAAERSFPVTTDIGALISHSSGDVGIHSDHSKEGATAHN